MQPTVRSGRPQLGAGDVRVRSRDPGKHAALHYARLEEVMTYSRSNGDLALMAVGLGVGSLAYTSGAFVMGLALHPPNQHGWSGVEMMAVGLYPLGWIGLIWAAGELWTRCRRKRGTTR
jgi:hypothetical protein